MYRTTARIVLGAIILMSLPVWAPALVLAIACYLFGDLFISLFRAED